MWSLLGVQDSPDLRRKVRIFAELLVQETFSVSEPASVLEITSSAARMHHLRGGDWKSRAQAADKSAGVSPLEFLRAQAGYMSAEIMRISEIEAPLINLHPEDISTTALNEWLYILNGEGNWLSLVIVNHGVESKLFRASSNESGEDFPLGLRKWHE